MGLFVEKEEMIYIDASAYLSLAIPHDFNRKKALILSELVFQKGNELITSQAILGEVLTVCSQKHNRRAAIDFIKDIVKSGTKIIFEEEELIKNAFKIFQSIKDKDISWVDCYSFAIIEHYKIERVFTFDKDFKKYAKAEIIE